MAIALLGLLDGELGVVADGDDAAGERAPGEGVEHRANAFVLEDFGANALLGDLLLLEQDRQHLRSLLVEGASSEAGPVADASYFAALRSTIHDDG